MFGFLLRQLTGSLGIVFRTIRAFFTRQLTRIGAYGRRVTNISRYATKVASTSFQGAAKAVKKPTKREDYIETRELLISKSFLLLLAAGLVIAGLAIYFVVWPFILSHFLTARFFVEDQRVADWTGRVIVYADEKKTQPLYAGKLEDGVLQGRGEAYDENGLLCYEGWFQDGVRSGSGSEYEDGVLVYEGQFAADVREGTGTAYDGGLMVYQGQFAAGLYEGRGKQYEDGVLRYEGSFQEGVPSGDGTAYYPSGGRAYTGQFAAGLYEGTGTAYDEEGQVLYEGAFSAGVYAGAGRLYLAQGETLEAEFADGEPQGVVQWLRGGQLYYEGEWTGGQPSGFGTLYSKSGEALYEGQFQGGTLDGAWLLGLTAEELREALGEGQTRNVSGAGSFTIVSDSLGLAAVCSLQTEEAEAQVYSVCIFQTEGDWVRLLPGMERVSLSAWPEGTERWSGQLSFTPPAGAAVEAGTYQGQVFTTPDCRVSLLSSGSGGGAEDAPVLLRWERLDPLPGGGQTGTTDGGSAGADGRMDAMLSALDLMEAPEGAAQPEENPYYGGADAAEALKRCQTLDQAVGLAGAMLDYWEQAERQSALEENLVRTRTLLDEAREAQSMGQGDGEALAALEAEELSLQGAIETCAGEREKAALQAQALAGVDPGAYDLTGLLVSFDPAEQNVTQLALVAAAWAMSAGETVDSTALTNAVKTALIDLTQAHNSVLAAQEAYQAAGQAAQQAAAGYAMGEGGRTAWYEALSAQAEARAELCRALAGFTRLALELDQTTGGWVSRTFDWCGGVLEPLFAADAEAAKAAQAAVPA